LLIGSLLIGVAVLIKPAIGYGYQARVCGFQFSFDYGGCVGSENWDYENPGWISFDLRGCVWTRGRLIEWLRWSGEPGAPADGPVRPCRMTTVLRGRC
jgi:hypothetical protein